VVTEGKGLDPRLFRICRVDRIHIEEVGGTRHRFAGLHNEDLALVVSYDGRLVSGRTGVPSTLK
jgi:hypothetical protein